MILKFTESLIDKSKVKFQDERTTYHEVPEDTNEFQEEPYDDQGDEYQDEREPYHEQDETYHEEDEKFEDQEQFTEGEEEYPQEDNVFNEEQRAEEQRIEFQPEQPKLTPKQWWHRAYNKVVMQLNVSTFSITMAESDTLFFKSYFSKDETDIYFPFRLVHWFEICNYVKVTLFFWFFPYLSYF